MGHNTKKITLAIHPVIEWINALESFSHQKQLIQSAHGVQFKILPAFFDILEEFKDELSRYLLSEINYFFGESINFIPMLFQFVTTNQSVTELIEILEERFLDHLPKYLKTLSPQTPSDHETLKEIGKNPLETRDRFILVLKQFYKKAYNPMEAQGLELLTHEVERQEQFYQESENAREHISELTHGKEAITIHLSLFKQINYMPLKISGEEWLNVGLYNRQLYEIARRKGQAEILFKILSDQKRLEMIMLLNKRPWYTHELAKALKISAPAITYHFNFLDRLDILSTNRQEHRIYYSIDKQKLQYLFKNASQLIFP